MGINLVRNTTPITGIGSSFDVNKSFMIDMNMIPPHQPFEGYFSMIIVQVSSISAATKLTIRVCKDSTGNECIITDTLSDLYSGISDSTKGSAIFALNAYTKVHDINDLYVFCKTDTGTITVDYIEITYEGDR